MKKPFISIAIPTHEMENGEYFFKRCMDSCWDQTFQDFEIVVTDNSDNNVIENLCEKWYKTGVKYFRNPRKGMAPNTNEAIKKSTGDLIKILYMDDYLIHNQVLEKIVRYFKGHWLVTGCTHTTRGKYFFDNHIPHYSEDIHTGHNTIGSPSVLTIKNENPLLFDEEMQWVLDCDYYRRMYDLYGKPVVLKEICTAIGLHEGQITNLLSNDQKISEINYSIKKYSI